MLSQEQKTTIRCFIIVGLILLTLLTSGLGLILCFLSWWTNFPEDHWDKLEHLAK